MMLFEEISLFLFRLSNFIIMLSMWWLAVFGAAALALVVNVNGAGNRAETAVAILRQLVDQPAPISFLVVISLAFGTVITGRMPLHLPVRWSAGLKAGLRCVKNTCLDRLQAWRRQPRFATFVAEHDPIKETRHDPNDP